MATFINLKNLVLSIRTTFTSRHLGHISDGLSEDDAYLLKILMAARKKIHNKILAPEKFFYCWRLCQYY